jgi:hypothetical protein
MEFRMREFTFLPPITPILQYTYTHHPNLRPYVIDLAKTKLDRHPRPYV